jgi:hypothetical protein
MKINLQDIDLTQFMVHQHVVNGAVLSLVQPNHIGCKWTQANKHFRSSLWDTDGELVSAGFPKFTNWGENPDNFPVPKSLVGTTVVEKLDGSLLIVSKYKGNYILRTRGTSDATKLDNGAELEIFRRDYLPRLVSFIEKDCGKVQDTWLLSYLFEWVSPVQKIILNYGDQPEWYLVGAVGHADYSIASQEMLDGLAEIAGFKRPVTYTFPSVEQLLADVEIWKGKEGVCVYSRDGQAIHKVKGAWYLALHRMKEALASFDKVVDVWYSQGEPDYQTFEANIIAQFDWELWQQCRGDASRICDGAKEVAKIVEAFGNFVEKRLKPLPSRKEQAVETIKAYGDTNRASFIFKLLDGKQLSAEDRKKLMYQVLKK